MLFSLTRREERQSKIRRSARRRERGAGALVTGAACLAPSFPSPRLSPRAAAGASLAAASALDSYLTASKPSVGRRTTLTRPACPLGRRRNRRHLGPPPPSPASPLREQPTPRNHSSSTRAPFLTHAKHTQLRRDAPRLKKEKALPSQTSLPSHANAFESRLESQQQRCRASSSASAL